MTDNNREIELTEMVEKIRSNDEEMIAAACNHYRSKMLNIAKMYTSNAADAEDAVQEAFVNAIRHIDKLEDPAKFESWLGSIVVNQAKTIARKSYHKHETSFTAMEDEDGDLRYDPSDEKIENQPDLKLDQETTRNMIYDILDDLTEEQRIVTVMYFYENKKLREIAEELKIPQSMVVGRLTTAKKNIKASVSEVQRKYDIKLYNFSGIPFFMWLISLVQAEDNIGLIPIGFSIAAPAAVSASEVAASAAAAASAKTIGSAGIIKLAAALCLGTAALLTGVHVLNAQNINNEPDNTPQMVSTVTITDEKDKKTDRIKAAEEKEEQTTDHEHDWQPVYTTVHHDAEGHYETVTENQYVVDEPAWDETKTELGYYCKDCGQGIIGGPQQYYDHILAYHYEENEALIQWGIGFNPPEDEIPYTVHHDETGHYENVAVGQTWVQDRAAYDETVQSGYQCSVCGEQK